MKPRDKFPLAHMLLRLWERYESGRQCAQHAGDIVQVDAARAKYHGIPSLVD